MGKKGVDSEGDADDVAFDVGDFATFATDFCGEQNSSEWGCARAKVRAIHQLPVHTKLKFYPIGCYRNTV